MKNVIEVNLEDSQQVKEGVEQFFADILCLCFSTCNSVENVLEILPLSILRDRMFYLRVEDLSSFTVFCDLACEHYGVETGDFELFPMPSTGWEMTELFADLTTICLSYIEKNNLAMNTRDLMVESVCSFLQTKEFKDFERQEISLEQLKDVSKLVHK